MKKSICQFPGNKAYQTTIQPVNFVYEKEIHTLKQPFFYTSYRLCLVTNGTATLKINNHAYELNRGCIFITYPAYLHTIEASDDFDFMYISFIGDGAAALLEDMKINMDSPIFYGNHRFIDFWFKSIISINPANINTLTEAVLLYTISFLCGPSEQLNGDENNERLLGIMLQYIDAHYCSPDISLGSLSKNLSYSEKYLSNVFTKKMGESFRHYVTRLRIGLSVELIKEGADSVFEIAEKCGFNDAFYFSKVFKKTMGVSPSEYIKDKLYELP